MLFKSICIEISIIFLAKPSTMNKLQPFSPEKFKGVLARQGSLQRGFVTAYSNIIVSQPQFAEPPVVVTDAILYLKLDIEPQATSDIISLVIRFEPEQPFYAQVEYSDRNGYASKPISHYNAIMDLLKSADANARRIEVLLQVNDDGRNTLALL